MLQTWSVTLTGAVLPGLPDEQVEAAWLRVAKLLQRDLGDFERQVAPRLPVTFKPLAREQAQQQCDALILCGVQALLLADDGRRLWLQLGASVRGPVCAVYAWQVWQREHGTGAGDVRVCRYGERRWQSPQAFFDAETPVENAEDGDEELALPVADPVPATVDMFGAAAPELPPGEGMPEAASSPGRVSADEPDPEPRGHAATLLPRHALARGLHAGFWRRVAAALLDSLILSALLSGVFYAAHRGWGVAVDWNVVTGAACAVAVATLAWLYWASCESSALQATPGKRALGLRVTDLAGARIGFGRATGRHFGKLLSMLILGVGFMLAGWTRRKRALHDLLAGTCVVHRRALEAFRRRDDDAAVLQRRPSRMPAWAIVLVVVFAGGVPMLAMLTPIAVPAYQDYVIRTQVAEGLALAGDARAAVETYVASHQGMPRDNAAADLDIPTALHDRFVASVEVRDGVVVVIYARQANQAIGGRHVVFTPKLRQQTVSWHCISPDIDSHYLPQDCR